MAHNCVVDSRCDISTLFGMLTRRIRYRPGHLAGTPNGQEAAEVSKKQMFCLIRSVREGIFLRPRCSNIDLSFYFIVLHFERTYKPAGRQSRHVSLKWFFHTLRTDRLLVHKMNVYQIFCHSQLRDLHNHASVLQGDCRHLHSSLSPTRRGWWRISLLASIRAVVPSRAFQVRVLNSLQQEF